jgi:hypothetical protein
MEGKMVTYRGYKTAVQYGAETAYGTGGVPNTAIPAKISTLTIEKNNNPIRTVGLGEGRNETFVGYGNFEVNWDMEMELAGFDFLQFAFSPIGGSGTTAAPYYLEELDFTGYGAGQMKSFAMEVASLGVPNEVELISGCVINTLGLTLAIGETLKCSVSGWGRNSTTGSVATAYTAITTKPWIFAQGNFEYNASVIGRVTSAAINISNNMDPETGRQIGSRYPEAAEFGLRKYDWVLTVKMTDTVAASLLQDFYGASGTTSDGVADAELVMVNINLLLSEGLSTGRRNAQIKLAQSSIASISKPITIGENIVELTINGQSKYGTTDTSNRPIKWWTAT